MFYSTYPRPLSFHLVNGKIDFVQIRKRTNKIGQSGENENFGSECQKTFGSTTTAENKMLSWSWIESSAFTSDYSYPKLSVMSFKETLKSWISVVVLFIGRE